VPLNNQKDLLRILSFFFSVILQNLPIFLRKNKSKWDLLLVFIISSSDDIVPCSSLFNQQLVTRIREFTNALLSTLTGYTKHLSSGSLPSESP
jgi:hypothetical protein